jgi:hypothetical protein
MLYSILVFISAVSGGINLFFLGKVKHIHKECKDLKTENEFLMKELNSLYNEKQFLKSDDPNTK